MLTSPSFFSSTLDSYLCPVIAPGITVEDMNTLPIGVALVIQDAVLHCRNQPPSNWKEENYNFIGRQDFAMLHLNDGSKIPPTSQKSKYCGEMSKYGVPKDSEDGLDYLDHEVLRLRFSRDHHIHDIYSMLQSSKPVRIILQQRPEVSDHEFIEEQERHLYSLCIRTMALPVGRRGTMSVDVTKLLSIHVEALLPPTSTELDVAPVVQVAAVLGVGLLYQGSAHHHMAEILLGEIGRPPGPEMEHCVDRESYALAAGLALGLVTFAKGQDVSGLTDLPMADQLYHYMVGAHKRPLTGVHKEKHKSPSYQIREGDPVDIDVTSPGATLALGMMFFDTGNEAIAEWMAAPDTQCLLDMVRPDFLLLRTLSKGLIMWSDVHPSRTWVKSHIPEIVSKHAFKRGQHGQGTNSDIDYETMRCTTQKYFSP